MQIRYSPDAEAALPTLTDEERRRVEAHVAQLVKDPPPNGKGHVWTQGSVVITAHETDAGDLVVDVRRISGR